MAHQSHSTDDYREILLAIRADLLASPRLRADDLEVHQIAEEDQAKMRHDEFVSLQLNHLDYVKLRSVTESLERISDGDYGLCGECGGPIASRRMRAIPWAKYCVTCQELRAHNDDQDMALTGLSHGS
jgi:DnaK suppressor protein